MKTGCAGALPGWMQRLLPLYGITKSMGAFYCLPQPFLKQAWQLGTY